MQHPSLSWQALWQVALPAIPARPEKSRIADSAQGRFGRERHGDFFAPVDLLRLSPDTVRVEGEIPRPVERVPGRALQLRTRISASAVIEILGIERVDDHESGHKA